MPASRKPNIILVMTDQQRFDRLGCMGDPMLDTPNIDSVAAEGVRFTNAYAASPVCAPSRAALKSGRYPPGCGVVANWVPFHERAPQLLTHRLSAVGYQTAMVGKLHFVPAEDAFGFDWKVLHDAPYSVYAWDDRHSEYIHWLRETAYRDRGVDPVAQFDEDENAFKRDDWYRFTMGSGFRGEAEHDIPWTVAQAERYLDERDRERPFFLCVSFFGPHQPFDPPAPWSTLYDPREITLPPQFDADMHDCPVFQATCAARAAKFRARWDRETYQRMVAAYYGQIAMIDHYLGRLFRRLRREGLWDDSLVVFASDHGDHNGAYGLFYKGEMYYSCAKVPLLVKPPRQALGASTPGAVREEVVNLLDL
ncbi:MAG: sulfatase-like hydrolase/transferase, partial [Chloroflexi bacterium]|nr:sulfatase-like hydrolase/transferase [Chloroflexota bacterium]